MDHLTRWDLLKKRDRLRDDIRFDANNRIARLAQSANWTLEYELLILKIVKLIGIDKQLDEPVHAVPTPSAQPLDK